MEHEYFAQSQDDESASHTSHSWFSPADDASASSIARIELEPGWSAMRSLAHVGSDELLAAMLRPSFRPVGDFDLVPVTPCLHCRDGGMRTAGSLRTRKGCERVRACDTCGAVEIGEPSPPLQQ